MSFDPFVASAPGKIILSGEHAVVHGAHAVATVVDRRAYALFSNSTSPDSVQFQFEYDGMIYLRTWTLAALQRARQQIDSIHPRCWNVDSIVDEKDETARVVDSIGTMDIPVHIDVFPAASQANSSSVSASDIAAKRAAATIISAPSNVFLMTFLLMFRAAHAVTVKIVSTVPMGSGMGSSAAFCTSLATGFFCLSRVPDAPCAALASPFPGGIGPAPSPLSVPLDRFVVNAWAFQGERLVHGTPSGVDNTCSVYGGVIVYRRRTEHPAEATNDIHTTNVDSFAAATAAAAAAAEAAQVLENKEDSNSFPAATLPVKRSPVPVRQGDAPEVYFLPSGCIPPSVELVVTDTRVPKDTRALVAGVGKLRSEMPEVVVPLLLAIDGISSRLISAVKTYCSFASVPPVSDAPIPSSKDADKHFEKVFAALSKKFDRSIARLEAQLSVAEASETKASADSGLESDSDDDNDDDDDEIDDDDSTSSTPPAQLSDIASRAAACVPEVSPAYDDLGQSLVSYKRVSVSVLRRRLAAARLRRDAAVAEAFFRCVGPLMSKNHELLNAIGVGHIALDTVVAVGNELGMHTKLTGAGGGGCAITLLPPLANKRSTLATSANKYAGELASAPDGPSAQSSMSEHHRLAAPEMIPRPHSGASGRSGVPANSSFPSGSSGGFTTLDAPMGSAPPAAIASAPQQTGMKRSALSCIALSIPTMPNVDSTTSLTSMGGSAAFDNGSTPLVSTLTLTSALSLVPNSASGGVPVPGSTPRSGLAGSSSRRRGVAQIAGGPISETGSSPSESPGAVTPPTPARALRPAPPTKTASSGSGRATPPVCRSTTPSTGLTPKHSNSHSSTQGPSHGRVHVASVPQPARAFDYDPVKELERRMEMRNFRCYRTQIGQGGANVMSMEDFISLGIA